MHAISESNGVAEAAYAYQPAWHGLGQTVQKAMTSAEALELAHLGWTVSKHQLQTAAGVIATGAFATTRDDTGAVLGVVGRQYKPLQNAEAFRLLDDLVGAEECRFESAGALFGGARVWMLARVPQVIRAAGDDVSLPYLLLSNGHDGRLAFRVFPTAVRVVCWNTLSMALGNGRGKAGYADEDAEDGRFVARHSSRITDKVADIARELAGVGLFFRAYQEQVTALVAKPVSGNDVRRYFEQVFPTRPTAKQLERAAARAGRGKAQAAVADGAALLESILGGTEARGDVMSELLAGFGERQTREWDRNKMVLETCLENFENERQSLPGVKGTAWAAYNSVSEYIDHQMKVRAADAQARREARMDNVVFGAGNETKQAAFAAALAL